MISRQPSLDPLPVPVCYTRRCLTAAVCIIAAFFSAYAVSFNRWVTISTSFDGYSAIAGNSATLGLTAIVFYRLYRWAAALRGRRLWLSAGLCGMVLALFDWLGYGLANQNAVTVADRGVWDLFYNLVYLTGLALLLTAVLALAFNWLIKHDTGPSGQPERRFFTDNARSFALVSGLILVCWLPYYLAYYPGIVTYDPYYQLTQAVGLEPLSGDNPVLHTLLMGGIVKLGRAVFGTLAAGVALFAAVQMLSMAALFSYTVFYMARRGIRPVMRLVVLAFYALYPMNALLSITLWKDVWLSEAVLLYCLFLLEVAENGSQFFRRPGRVVALGLTMLAVCFFKGTGIVVLLVSLPFVLVTLRRGGFKPMLVLALTCLALYGVVSGPVFTAMGIQSVSLRTPLSLPLQQIARMVRDHEEDIPADEQALIGTVFPYDQLAGLYNPRLADPVKDTFNDTVFKENPGLYIRLWLRLGIYYPKSYLSAFLNGSFGYWYPHTRSWVIGWPYEEALQRMLGNTVIVELDPDADQYGDLSLLPGFRDAVEPMLEHMQETPVLSLTLSIGFFAWLLLAGAAACAATRRTRLLVPYAALLAVWLTCLASPVAAEYRYAYPLVLAAPPLLAFTAQRRCRFLGGMVRRGTAGLPKIGGGKLLPWLFRPRVRFI